MYSGAVPWRHRYTSTASLNCTRSATSSQWSSSCSSRDKPTSNFQDLVLLTTRARRIHHTLQLVCRKINWHSDCFVNKVFSLLVQFIAKLHATVSAQREAPAASGLSPSGQSIHVYRADEVLHFVRLSVLCLYDLLKIGMSYKLQLDTLCNFTSNWDSHRFHEWMTITC